MNLLSVKMWRFLPGVSKISASKKIPLLGPVSRKPRKRLGPGKPYLVISILKTEKSIGLKLCMKRTSVNIKNIVELKSSVAVTFEISVWLSGCEILSGPSRNGSLMTLRQQLSMNFANTKREDTEIFNRSGN